MKRAVIFLLLIFSGLTTKSGSVKISGEMKSTYVVEHKTIKMDSLIRFELEAIKLFEVGKSKQPKLKPHPDPNTNDYLIGYGFVQRYWWKADTMTQYQADSLLYSIFNIMLKSVNKKYPNMSYEQSLKVAHLFFWIGPKRASQIIPDGELDTTLFIERYGKYKSRSNYFIHN